MLTILNVLIIHWKSLKFLHYLEKKMIMKLSVKKLTYFLIDTYDVLSMFLTPNK